MNVMFSINTYDSDGDIVDTGVFLHFGDSIVKVSDSPEEFGKFVYQIRKIHGEISEEYA